MKTKTVTTTRYTTDLGVELSFEPANDDDVIVTEKDGKLYVWYLVQDKNPESPVECGDASLFLVNYHRDFDVRRDCILTKDDVRNVYWGKKPGSWAKKYWHFPLSMLSHSGVWLSLSHSFADDSGGWDTSHVGLVLVARKYWKTGREARAAAESLVTEWNQYLQGDVWGMCTDVFDVRTKQLIEADSKSCWGCYDYDYCLKELKNESEAK
jgi:hypothetical protein